MVGCPLGTRPLLLTKSRGAPGEQAQARGSGDRADAGADVELAEHVVDVSLHRADRELQVGGDLGLGPGRAGRGSQATRRRDLA
jgi:hypothetical protein